MRSCVETAWRLSFALIGLAVASCGPADEAAPPEPAARPPDAAVVAPRWDRDLLAEIDLARRWAERGRGELDFDRALESFTGRWRVRLRDRQRLAKVYGVGESSRFELFVAEPRPLELELACWAESVPEGASRSVEIAVGGRVIGRLELGEQLRRAELPVPRALLRRGTNEVTLRYLGAVTPAKLTGGDDPQLPERIGCVELGWHGLRDVELPTRRPGGGLRLPAGSAVDFHVDLPPGGRLGLRGVRSSGARLVLEVTPVAGPPRDVPLPEQPRSRDGSLDLDLALGPPGPARIRLLASGDRGQIEIDSAGLDGPPRQPDASTGVAARPPLGAKPHIIVYLVDTLRRDRLSTYGYARPTSPHLDRFAGEAVRFDRAFAQAPWTTPAVASLFTGLESQQHGANRFEAALPDQAATLAELLGAVGYQTVAFAGSEVISRASRFDQGFAHFADLCRGVSGVGPPSTVVIDRLEEWLADNPIERPLFLYVHTVDPHGPYEPPEKFRARFAASAGTGRMTVDDLLPSALPAANALYDAEVAYADASFGRFLALLARHGLDRDAIIVFVADHGEQFLEHGGWRHRDLFGEVTHIPLVIKVPASLGGRAGATAEPASQIDLLPTLADVVGFPVPEASAGKSLLPALVPGRGRVARRPIHAHNLREEREEWSVVDGTYKLIWRHHRRYHETLLYDLAQDLAETTDLAAEQPVRRAYLEALIAQERFGLAPLFEQPRGIPTEELRRRMRALGYVQ